MLDLGFSPAAVKAVPILARTAGLLAHLAEERQQPLGFLMAGAGRGGDRVPAPAAEEPGLMLAPEVETRPWAEQLALDDAHYRNQLAYLFDRSAFYREKLAAAGFASAREAGGLAEIAQLPLTEKHELRATCTPENPIGAHLCAAPSEIVRIYSTSGTTGAPSYIPLTAGDLDNWVTGSARSYAASGIGAGPAHRLHLQRRAVRGRRGARRVRPHRPLPHPGRHREHRAADAGDRAAAARGGGAHAVLRRLPHRVGGGARRRPARLERRARARRGRARRRRAGLPREGSRRAGARGSPRRWASATSASRCGASARSRTACTSARAASSTPS